MNIPLNGYLRSPAFIVLSPETIAARAYDSYAERGAMDGRDVNVS